MIDRSTRIEVPAGRYRHALRTAEATDLEPGVLDDKVFVGGVGEVLEQAVEGPVELIELIDLRSSTSLNEITPPTGTAATTVAAILDAGLTEPAV